MDLHTNSIEDREVPRVNDMLRMRKENVNYPAAASFPGVKKRPGNEKLRVECFAAHALRLSAWRVKRPIKHVKRNRGNPTVS